MSAGAHCAALGDDVSYDFVRITYPRARKAYDCRECATGVLPGAVYEKTVYRCPDYHLPGEIETVRVCGSCCARRRAATELVDDEDCWPIEGELDDYIVHHITDRVAFEALAKRYLAQIEAGDWNRPGVAQNRVIAERERSDAGEIMALALESIAKGLARHPELLADGELAGVVTRDRDAANTWRAFAVAGGADA
ncbi:hypothetical protein [Oceanibacterium hippocampi]|uniref:Uncharacterized protein n=1 Tax=Oceanibacterium hippocampi TaxID=745714 RepID=A0A1Y5TZA3_9PROT|nr:hypothetical protein [Oceanibacterium hippocampi]SLN77267.1 hypothetical protein OCH7691_04360 [Oceanibacterium hippocampi]